MHVCAPHVCLVSREVRRRALDALESELQMVLSHLIRVLGSLHEQQAPSC